MRRKIWGIFLILTFLLPAGCNQAAKTPLINSTQGEKTIAIAEFTQEVDVFVPTRTTIEDFVVDYGQDAITSSIKNKRMISGFMRAVKDYGGGKINVVPILGAKGGASAPLERKAYDHFKDEILAGLRKVPKLDGIYLSLHGSMGVEGMYDPEGELLQAIRDEFGAAIPIATSYDLHANITEKKTKLATFIVGFKTNPHRDLVETGYSAGKILIKTVFGEVHPVMTVNKMRLLRGGGQNMDFLEPMDKVFRRMAEMEKMPGVLSVSNFMVHLWVDTPDQGWATVAVTDNDRALADKLADEIAERDWAERDFKMTQTLYSPSEAVKAARDSWVERLTGITMFCDVSDIIGCGSPGESTYILKALVEEGPDMVSYLSVKDEELVNQLWDVPLNQTVTITVGGKIDKKYSIPYKYTGQVIIKGNARGYNRPEIRVVVVKNNGVHLVLTEYPDSINYPTFFTSLGLDLWKADIVVVKNLFPFRIWFLKYNRKTINVITPGTSNIDVFQLEYKHLGRPIYPLDKVDSWQWQKWSTVQ